LRYDDTSTDAEIAERVEVRLARRSVLEREPDPLGLVAVLHEGVLRDVVGGPASWPTSSTTWWRLPNDRT
jgi:hypothetical protein